MALFVIDIGNTNIVFGVYSGDELIASWRLSTRRDQTADEYGILVSELFEHRGLVVGDIDGVIVSCVVPSLESTFRQLSEQYFSAPALFVGPGVKTGMPILYDNPREVGADRIVNAVAAYQKYRRALVVVDFGTATTFDAVSAKGEYLGGAIAPGIGISMNALFSQTSKLPSVPFANPKTVIGKNTAQSIQAGMFFGYVGMVDALVRRQAAELGGDVAVIATGGLARLVCEESETIDEVDDDLTLRGLLAIHRLNS
ncbi:MAG: type III pantothenate kinase [Deltaproteobacteria bacterium]|nr:type III pantothenate kinase [Deltaproteobacteria bacterium]